MSTQKEILEKLGRDDLTKAFNTESECFGKEYDPADDVCVKECADHAICKEVFEAPKTAPVEAQEDPTEAIKPVESKEPVAEKPATEEPPVSDTPTTEPVKEESPMAEEKQAAPAAAAEKPAADPKKEAEPKPKGFGDRTAKKDQFGFTEGTKGAFIAAQLSAAPITKADLLTVTNAKFETDSTGRVNMVMYKLRDREFELIRTGKHYYIKNVTPADKVAEVEKLAAAEAEKLQKIKDDKKAEKADAKAKKDADAKAKKDAEATPPETPPAA